MERKIVVYSATGWASCHSAKEFLSHHKIPFTDRNVVEDTAAMTELVEKIGRLATPVIVMDGEIIVGFDRRKLQRLLGLWHTQCELWDALSVGEH